MTISEVRLDDARGPLGMWPFEGVTFRQRRTQGTDEDASDDPIYNGVVEARFPGGGFTQVLDEVGFTATSAPQATLRQVGSKWLLERTASHGSEGMYASEAEAVMCDLPGKRCSPPG